MVHQINIAGTCVHICTQLSISLHQLHNLLRPGKGQLPAVAPAAIPSPGLDLARQQYLESSGPMDLVCIDFLKVDADRWNKSDILDITDHFTRFARAVPTRNQTAREVANVMWKEFFLDFGFPRRLHSDRGASFTGKLVRELAKLTGIKSSFTTPYHPQDNASVERLNRTLLSMLGVPTDTQKSEWSKHIRYLAHAYNCTRNDATGYSPFYLMFLRHPRLKVDWLFASDPEQIVHQDIDMAGPCPPPYVEETMGDIPVSLSPPVDANQLNKMEKAIRIQSQLLGSSYIEENP